MLFISSISWQRKYTCMLIHRMYLCMNRVSKRVFCEFISSVKEKQQLGYQYLMPFQSQYEFNVTCCVQLQILDYNYNVAVKDGQAHSWSST